MDNDMINMRLHEVERVYYDPRADFLAAVALDDNVSVATEQRLLREAEAIYRRARAYPPQPGPINVRSRVVDVLRRMGA